MSERIICTGNQAVCYGPIDAGCRHFFGYPITPQNDIPKYMAAELPKIGALGLDLVEKTLQERMTQENKESFLPKNLEALRWGYQHFD